jgi:hypothetical protein
MPETALFSDVLGCACVRLEQERPQAMAASVFVEGGWLNPEVGEDMEQGADLALTFPDVQLGPGLQRTLSR